MTNMVMMGEHRIIPKAIKFAVIILIIAGVIYAAVSAFLPPQNNSSTYGLSGSAPLFTIDDINGTEISLSDFKGKIVVLYFIGSIYEAEINEIDAIWASYRGENVVVIGVINPTCSCTVDLIYTVRRDRNFTWFLARDDAYVTNSLYSKSITSHGEPYFPTVVLIDKNLDIARVYGFVPASTLSSEIESLIKK